MDPELEVREEGPGGRLLSAQNEVSRILLECLHSAFLLKSVLFLSQLARLQTTTLCYNKG